MPDLKFDNINYRIHNDKNKRVIRKSLEDCGAGRSVLVDKDNILIAGNEEWRPIKDFEGFYEVSNFGHVRSIERYVFCRSKTNPKKIEACIRKLREDRDGYLTVSLKNGQITKLKKAHRLVAEAFIDNPLLSPEVNHINGIKSDNRVENLEWATTFENSRHRTINRLTKPILSDEQIEFIQKNAVILNDGKKHLNSVSDLARKFNVCRNTITDILRNRKLYLNNQDKVTI